MKRDLYFDSGFENADKYNDFTGLVTSLEIQEFNPILLELRHSVYKEIAVNKGEYILDVGCGLGGTVRDIAKIVGKDKHVIGVDKSTLLLNESKRRTNFSDCNIDYVEADVNNLQFDNESFAFTHAERVLMHIPEPYKALSEMIRVLKKGGKIAITEPDLSSVKIYPNPQCISDLVMKKWCSYTESPTVGANLVEYFHELSLSEVSISARTLLIRNYFELNQIRSLQKLITALVGTGEITENMAIAYVKSLEDSDKQGLFLFYLTVFTAIGIK